MASSHQPESKAGSGSGGAKRFVFPRWANYVLPLAVVGALGAGLYVPTVIYFGFSPKATARGYAPEQPVPYSHALHAGTLGIDCRYCHNSVEGAAFAAIPPTQTCMNCHTNIKGTSPNLKAVKESWEKGTSVPWVKIHDLPDYAYFNHAAHVNKGVGCVSCHGRVDQMEVVQQVEPLSMGWCLDCHRAPEKFLRPRDQVTNMGWTPKDSKEFFDVADQAKLGENPADDQIKLGLKLKKQYGIHDVAYMTSCYVCHR